MSAAADVVEVKALRCDAARNRDRILDAARATFNEEGLDAGMDVIAQRAHVGVGTIYRRFPSKEDLIAAVLDEILVSIRDLVAEAHAHDSVAEGFGFYLTAMGQLQVDHIGFLPRLWSDVDDEVRREITELALDLLARAQAAGVVRSDVVYADVLSILWSLRGIIDRTAAVSPDAWKRYLELVSQSLLPGGAALQNPPMTQRQADAVARSATS